MCKCICKPKKSGLNKKCKECYPGRKPKGHDKQTHDEIKQRRARRKALGIILMALEHEPLPSPDSK